MIDKGIRDKGFISNPSNCECEYDKSCDVGEPLDYTNCKFTKKLLDKLVDCRKNAGEMELNQNKMIYNSNLNNYEKICSSCITYLVAFMVFIIISISISSVFIYFQWYLKRKYIETTICWMQVCWTYISEILNTLILRIIHITF